MRWFRRNQRPRPVPVSAVMCRRRLPELPSIVCQLPRGHVAFHRDDRDPDFCFQWAAPGVVVEKWPKADTWWEAS